MGCVVPQGVFEGFDAARHLLELLADARVVLPAVLALQAQLLVALVVAVYLLVEVFGELGEFGFEQSVGTIVSFADVLADDCQILLSFLSASQHTLS